MNTENTAVNALYPIHYHGAVGMFDTNTGRVTMVDSDEYMNTDKLLQKDYGDDYELLGLC